MDSWADMKLTALVAGLRACRLFQGLPTADLRTIAGISVTRQLAKDDYLFHEGEPSQGFFVVRTGGLNVHRLSGAGKEQVIHIFRAGDSLAEATLATETGYPADARALESTQVLMVQKPEFLALLRRQPDLALRMLSSMSQHLKVLVARIEDLTLKDVETRLANWLIKRCPDPESPSPVLIELPVTKRVLAAELGTVSETFSRTLAKFREQKLLIVSGKTLKVVSPARLTALLKRGLNQ